MYKFSKFNVITRVDTNSFAIFNSLTLALAEISEANYIKIKNSTILDEQNSSFFKDMLSNFFILSEDINEEYKIEEIEKWLKSDEVVSFIIVPTEACNFRCKYCYEKFNAKRITPKEYESILEFIKKKTNLKLINIGWFGGEPTLEAKAIKVFLSNLREYCNDKNIEFSSYISTNGYLLDDTLFAEFINLGISGYQITVDGLQIEHDVKRPLKDGKGTFAKIIQNLSNIKKRSDDFHIIIRYNFDKKSNLKNFIDFYSDIFGNDSRFGLDLYPICSWSSDDNEPSNNKEISNESSIDYDFNLFEHESYALSKGINLSTLSRFTSPLADICYANKSNSMVIRPGNRINKCTIRLDSEENFVGRIDNQGNLIYDEEKWKLWSEPKYQKKCIKCPVRPLCLSRYCPERKIGERDISCRRQIIKEIKHTNLLKLRPLDSYEK